MKVILAILVTATLSLGFPLLTPSAHGAAPPTSLVPKATADPTPSPRDTLAAVPPSPQLKQAVAQFLRADPSASFSWLRGHVGAFSARPKPSVPEYARPILLAHGLDSSPVAQPEEKTTLQPHSFDSAPKQAMEGTSGATAGPDGADDPPDSRTGGAVAHDSPASAAQPTTWYPQAGGGAAKEVLTAFLRKHRDVFELDSGLLEARLPNLTLVKYGVGKHFRRAEFTQNVAGTPVLDGKTLVLFDLNWNVIAISRQLVTPRKLPLKPGAAIDQERAQRAATNALVNSLGKSGSALTITESRLGIDVLRALRAWQVDVLDARSRQEFTVTLDALDGRVLNISDNTANYTDAQVRRWDYAAGDLTAPSQVTSQNIYTHDDESLVHDFFYIANDDRNDGGTGPCTTTSPASSSTPAAYGTTTSPEYIRPSRRDDRDFSGWGPSSSAGAFGEGHVYYWAREYMLWQKQALVDLGVLTLGNFNNYIKTLIVVNACEGGAGNFSSSRLVSTYQNAGEGLSTIFLPERCRSGNPNCAMTDYTAPSTYWYTFEDNGGYSAPGVIHHELNHFVMIEYLGVMNSLDCSNRTEHKYFQEGGLGRTLAQMYWHHRYGVDYIPEDKNWNKLFRSHPSDTGGRAHDWEDSATLNEMADFACGDGIDDPYSWGGVVHQPLWEIYHGEEVDGASHTSMQRPAEDLGMIKALYYAADLTSAADVKDRFELAQRFMEFWELFSNAVPTTKSDWCDAWAHHGMKTYINVDYCS